MGVPKFFRWMGERYPLCCQLITENAIPEFDNLYLDMNGIIHNCSLPNDSDAHFRMSEDKIFLAIFNYIDHLFMKIKPQKVFFMALDGVAPRAKMNQQRSRRFRTAKDAEDARRKAIAKGEELPEEEPFDRNCITPGTPFMKRLSAQLEYFISKKMTDDSSWHNIKVILSGHEVPGEGEHKIMEYIRLSKAQKDYNPNTRHCLYGLDADLIMLGLLSHEPHFALLREEVTFGRVNKKKGGVDTQNFFLLHLSLLREYLDLEFRDLQKALSFPYDLERIIDDFVLMCLFVGNDFLPHLPHLHIADGALSLLFKIYKRLLPTAGGYLQDSGEMDSKRVGAMIHELAEVVEHEAFEAECDDLRYLGSKMAQVVLSTQQKSNGKRQGARASKPAGDEIVMSKRQKELYDQIKDFVLERQEILQFPKLAAVDRKFVKRVASAIQVRSGIEADANGVKCLYIEFDEAEDEEDVEAQEARARVMRKYDQAKVVDDEVDDEKQRDELAKAVYNDRFTQWKKEYYQEKPEIESPEDIREMVFKYTEGMQWVLHYYYKGVASWAWFYPYHYAPKMSDLINLEEFNIPFELGEPFKPYEQLMGVLPEASKQHIPQAYWDLITKESSPIRDFYPKDFELDMNGKKYDWEAVIRIPFIDQDRLLAAMRTRDHLLSEEEVGRNGTGESALFTRDNSLSKLYSSPLPEHFPDVVDCKCKREVFHLPVIEGVSSLRKGLCEGALQGANALFGFPSMHTIKHTGLLGFHGIQVFQLPSRGETMVVTIENRFEDMTPEQLALSRIGQRVYVGWPYLKEGVISSISDEFLKYEVHLQGKRRVVSHTPHRHNPFDSWKKQAEKIETTYNKRFGVIIGEVEFTAQVQLLKGLRRETTGALVKVFCKPEEEQNFAIQTIVDTVQHPDPRTEEQLPRPLKEEFPIDSFVFFLGHGPHYGSPAQVIANSDNALALRICILPENQNEPTFGHEVVNEALNKAVYLPAYAVSKKVGMSSYILSKLTSSLHVVYRSTDRRVNLGLNLKFEVKKQKVLGYTRKTDSGWEYSEKAVGLLQAYKQLFPDFIAGLEKNQRQDIYIAEEMYPQGDSVGSIKKIEEWLKKSKIKELERVDLEAMQLDKDTIALIEKAANEYVALRPAIKHILVKNISRNSMLKPSYAATLLTDQSFQLGDRVVFVQDSGTVPIGAKGTVVSVDRLEIEVVFDDMFMSGMDLGGRCSMHRGMTVGRHSILNMSNPQCNQKNSPTEDSSRPDATSRSTGSPRTTASPRPRPTAIIQRPDPHKSPMNGAPRGWEIMGVPPTADPRPKNPRPPRPSNRPVNQQQPARPNLDQMNMNQSLGFVRPRVRAAAPLPSDLPDQPNQPDHEVPAASHQDLSALLMGMLHKNGPPENGASGVHGTVNGLYDPSIIHMSAAPPPPQPQEGTTAAELLACLRSTPLAQQLPQQPPQQHHHQQQWQQQQQQSAWQESGHIQAHHGRSNGHQQGSPSQRGGSVQRQPRPPPPHAHNGPSHQGGHHNGPRPGGGPANRGGNRGGNHGQHHHPSPQGESVETGAPANTDVPPKKGKSKEKERNAKAKADTNAETNTADTETNSNADVATSSTNGNGTGNERSGKRPKKKERKKQQQQQQTEGSSKVDAVDAASLNETLAPAPTPAADSAPTPAPESASATAPAAVPAPETASA